MHNLQSESPIESKHTEQNTSDSNLNETMPAVPVTLSEAEEYATPLGWLHDKG